MVRAPQALPAGADTALDATVVIKSKEGFGSGFFLNSEGLILTAAHVVDGANDLTVHTRSGFQVPATVVRMDRASDVALLRVKAKNQPCLSLSTGLPKAGAEAYAMGSPADEKLAFSVSRGIVSGVRSFDEQQRIQTDASVSPGNSGGPLVGRPRPRSCQQQACWWEC